MGTRRQILIVDDDPDIRDTVGDVLADEGYDVKLAANGREALDWLVQAERLPDLVLLDLMMPELDGWGFVAEVDRSERFAALPIVIFSAHAAAHQVASPKLRGHVGKPLQLQELLDVVARLSG
jgi:CheY-like chemotaxis protein